MSSYLQVNKLLGPEKTQEILKGWKPMSCRGQVQEIKAWLKNLLILSEDKKKGLAHKKENRPVGAPQDSTSKNTPQQLPNTGKQTPKRNQKGKAQMEQALPPELQDSKERRQPWTMCSIWKELFWNSKKGRRK
ncbi:hypothetical protein O181_036271 [Austropuccinia psidii MF-1]|uniref:Uncharacterized protein n=1 Tax=Austropuccinia psidii MF-1 TaxID=1389203 RepID=A0A9Q3H9S3_9BASI|nr:hypothetical protein [Austropuccinia psidii MF-1]